MTNHVAADYQIYSSTPCLKTQLSNPILLLRVVVGVDTEAVAVAPAAVATAADTDAGADAGADAKNMEDDEHHWPKI